MHPGSIPGEASNILQLKIQHDNAARSAAFFVHAVSNGWRFPIGLATRFRLGIIDRLAFRTGLGESLTTYIFLDWHWNPMSDKIIDTLTGTYFTLDDPDGSYGTGQVIRLAAEGIYFVRFDGNEVTLPLELISLGEMLETTDEEYKIWRFFDTIEEREKWIEWLDAPSKPRVISLVRPTKPSD